MKERNHVIDWMRVIGLVGIFFAHCSLPLPVHYFRSFDVVLLFFVSGISFGLSSFTWSKENYWNYLKKRIIRLVIPTWIYLAVFFLVFHFIPGYDFTTPIMIKSFLFTAGGILFVWVYRIFIGTAITTPLLTRLLDNVNNKAIIFGSAGVLLLNDCIYHIILRQGFQEMIVDLFSYIVTFTVGYGIITFLGARFIHFTRKEQVLFSLYYGAIFLILALFHQGAHLEGFKYPPQTYYVSYGLAWSGGLYLLLSRYVHKPNSIIEWISRYSMRIYLAHIAVYYLLFPVVHGGLLQFIVFFGTSCLLVLFYNSIEKYLRKNNNG